MLVLKRCRKIVSAVGSLSRRQVGILLRDQSQAVNSPFCSIQDRSCGSAGRSASFGHFLAYRPE